MSLQGLLIELESFDVLESIDKSIIKNEKKIVDLNIKQHIDEGVDNTGLKFSSFEPYKQYTIEVKTATGTLTNGNPDIVNLNQKGLFHAGFFVDRIAIGEYRIDSKDKKRDKLVDKYDPPLFGLTDQNQAKLNEEDILPDIIDDICNAISKGINKR